MDGHRQHARAAAPAAEGRRARPGLAEARRTAAWRGRRATAQTAVGTRPKPAEARRTAAWPVRRAAAVLAALAALLLALAALAGCGATDTAADGAAGGGAVAPPPAALDDSPATPGPTPSPSPTATRASSTAASGPVTTIVFVNVGQGDAILIDSGATEVLVDGGPEGSGAAVARAMRRAGIDDLDVVVATHGHADHVNATDELVELYRPAELLVAGACDATLRASARDVGARLRQVRRGATCRWGAVKAKVLSPTHVSGEANEDSVVLLLEVAGRRILLTGDLTGPNEAAVGSVCARGPPLLILKVAHHGSRYSTSAGFLDDTRPRFAVISVGPNSYGHPSPDTVRRLRAAGARTFTTQKNGTVTVTIKPSGAVRWQFGRTSKPVTSVGASSGSTSSTASSSSSSSTASSSDPSTTVYITATGGCYHRGACRYLSQSKIAITLAAAKALGYRPCSVCRPPE